MAVDLADFEKRLNDDPNLQSEFLQDPVSVVEREGLGLSQKMKENLERFVKELRDPQFSAPGSSTSRSADGILISIGKSF